jgi:hypothetical protein
VPEEQARKKRRRRRGRAGRRGERIPDAEAEAPEKAQAQARTGTPPVTWQWLTFPVFCAFVCGALVILLIGPRPNTNLYSVLFFVFLGAGAFGLAHIATRLLIARRRK